MADSSVSIENDFFLTSALVKDVALLVILSDNEDVVNSSSSELPVEELIPADSARFASRRDVFSYFVVFSQFFHFGEQRIQYLNQVFS